MQKTSARSYRAVLRAALGLAGAMTLLSCSPFATNKLEAVKFSGQLVVLTRNSPTTYYEGPEGPTGFEYELAKAFADRLGVALKLVVPNRFADILPMVQRGQGDMAAAGLTVTDARRKLVRFTPAYQEIRQQLVYRYGARPPGSIKALGKGRLEVVAGTSYVERLNQLRLLHPELHWHVNHEVETEELLLQVKDGVLDYTIADSNIVAVTRQFYPNLEIAFDLTEPESLAWAFPLSDDDSLYSEAVNFINELRASGALASLLEKYYGAASRFNPINIAAFISRIADGLPTYENWFQQAGKEYDLDWRLLAALSYQESFWSPDAVSFTGVRGIMMLTKTTAEYMGVTDRTDPEQSIMGGARYLRSRIDRLPDRIREPDRTWMALAAYNVGIHHLEDARVITQKRGGNPDKWADVRENLPLLAKHAWYSKTRYGYARGYEPVQFVDRIRTYYEVLKKIDDERAARRDTEMLRLQVPAI